MAAPGGTADGCRPRAPGRLAFRYVRGLQGWTRSPVLEDPPEDALLDPADPDEIEADHRVALAPPADTRALLAPLGEQAAVDHEAAAWATQWATGSTYIEPDFPVQQLVAPAPLVLWAFDHATASFPVATGLGADNVSPRALLRLPDALRLVLLRILMLAERLGQWPQALNLVLIVLLAKADGGLRPIGLFPTLVRVWMRARSAAARAWEAAHALPGVYGGAGRGAQRAAWAAAFAAEASARRGRQHVASLLDLVKAFERVPHRLVAEAAVRWGFNLVVLRLSLAAYRLHRAIGVDGTFSILLVATRGLPAGSGFATVELRLILHEAMVIAGGR